ncbi:hypothetical protein VNO78_33261 [Psophocarpus tetragonolobus]|uniref:SKP1-like protein n=1 Tax=Psophocarpus tetragonolobus TaxID=3891 RepID=A0AAN9NWP4_PSOTE
MAEEAGSSGSIKGQKTKKIMLKTSDQVTFEVEPSIAKQMETVQTFIDADGDNNDCSIVVPLPNVTSRDLGRIIEYSRQHNHGRTSNLKEFDERFLARLTHEELKELLLVANYLNMKNLLDFLARSIADLIKNKSVAFVRNFFGCVNDFTPEEESEIRHKHPWAFEDVDED